MWLVEQIIRAIRENASEIASLFKRPGSLVIHVNPNNKREPVKLEVDRLKLN